MDKIIIKQIFHENEFMLMLVYSVILFSHRKKLLNIAFIICNLKLTKDAEAPNSLFLL